MAGKIVLCAITSQAAPLVRYYSQRASNAATQSVKVWKKPSQVTLKGKKINLLKDNEVPTPMEIVKDHSLLQDLIRYYQDPKKHSGK